MVLDDLIEKATNEGREEGLAEGRDFVTVNYLKRDPDAVSASDMLGLPIDLIRKIAADNNITLK